MSAWLNYVFTLHKTFKLRFTMFTAPYTDWPV